MTLHTRDRAGRAEEDDGVDDTPLDNVAVLLSSPVGGAVEGEGADHEDEGAEGREVVVNVDGEPAAGGPGPVDGHGVHQAGDHHAVGEVGRQLAPLRHSAAHAHAQVRRIYSVQKHKTENEKLSLIVNILLFLKWQFYLVSKHMKAFPSLLVIMYPQIQNAKAPIRPS